MTVVVLGSTGMLGTYVSSYLNDKYNVRALNRNDFDATTEFDFNLAPDDVVINCVGVLKPYIDSVGRLDTIKINSVFPQAVSEQCHQAGAKFIHICSDCVFSGQKGSYVETDICDGGDLYAMTKAIEPTNACIIRTSFIGEDNNEDGVGLLQWILRQKEVDGYDNCYWNGVTALQLAKIIEQIIDNELYWVGVRHVFSPDIVSKYDLCQLVSNVYKLDLNINRSYATNIAGTSITGKLDRSLSTMYDNQFSIPSLKEQLKDLKRYSI